MTVIIGVDPHRSTHTVAAIDGDERPLARVKLVADRPQVQLGDAEVTLSWFDGLGSEVEIDYLRWTVERVVARGRSGGPGRRADYPVLHERLSVDRNRARVPPGGAAAVAPVPLRTGCR